jgi:hypothetical protein
MSREAAMQTASHCSCGHPLTWEHRDGFGKRRSLALCQNPDCGVITTALPEGIEPEQRLASCLLGRIPTPRYLKPWVRLYFKTIRWGFIWRPFHEVCPDCAGDMTVQLALPPHMERQSDPYEILLCLTCGTTGVAWYTSGERVAIAMEGSEWDEPSTAVVILKRILEERATMAREGRSWDCLP